MCVHLWFSPSGSSCGVVCLVICWKVNLIWVQVLPWRFVGWSWAWSTVISGVVSWRTSICGWSAMRSDMVCHGEINGCNLYRWSVSIVSYFCGGCDLSWFLWPWSNLCMNHVTTQAADVSENEIVIWISLHMSHVFMDGVLKLDLAWQLLGGFDWWWCCWGSWRRYPAWTIHDNVTIFVTLIASNMRAISCYMSLFLTPETVIFFMGHHVDWVEGEIIM